MTPRIVQEELPDGSVPGLTVLVESKVTVFLMRSLGTKGIIETGVAGIAS